MSYFFAEPVRHTLSITRKALFEGHERGTEQARITPLNAVEDGSRHAATEGSRSHRGGTRLVAQMIEFPAGGTACMSDCLYQTTGLIYVLEGQLQVESGGLNELLKAGDCAYVDSDLPLAWSAAGKHRCRVLAVFPGLELRTEG